MEVCEKLFLPKIKGFPSFRFDCWAGKEQTFCTAKLNGGKERSNLLTHSVLKNRRVKNLMLGAAFCSNSRTNGSSSSSSK
jgi:hypothetical protein